MYPSDRGGDLDDYSNDDIDLGRKPRDHPCDLRRHSFRAFEDKFRKGNSLKLVILMFSRNCSKWSGPGDELMLTGEFVKHFIHVMNICEAKTSTRMSVLLLALKCDAQDEYNQNFHEVVQYIIFRNVSSVIKMTSRRQ